MYYILFYEVVEDHVTRPLPIVRSTCGFCTKLTNAESLSWRAHFRSRSTELRSSFVPRTLRFQDVSQSAIRTSATAWSHDRRCASGTSRRLMCKRSVTYGSDPAGAPNTNQSAVGSSTCSLTEFTR